MALILYVKNTQFSSIRSTHKFDPHKRIVLSNKNDYKTKLPMRLENPGNNLNQEIEEIDYGYRRKS